MDNREDQRNYPKCSLCGSTARSGSPFCTPCAEKRFKQQERRYRLDRAFEHLQQVAFDYKLGSDFVSAIAELVMAQIRYTNGED